MSKLINQAKLVFKNYQSQHLFCEFEGSEPAVLGMLLALSEIKLAAFVQSMSLAG